MNPDSSAQEARVSRVAHRLIEARRAMREFWGPDYYAEVEPARVTYRAAEDPMKAALEASRRAAVRGDTLGTLIGMAALADVLEGG